MIFKVMIAGVMLFSALIPAGTSYAQRYAGDVGMDKEDIEWMVKRNPAKLAGLES